MRRPVRVAKISTPSASTTNASFTSARGTVLELATPKAIADVRWHPRESLALGGVVLSRLALRSAAENGYTHEGLTWHWTADGGHLFHPDPVQRLRGIWAYHVNTLGYGDIAYEGAFDADGNTFGLRDNRYVGAHAQSTLNEANRKTDGIVFLEDARGWTPAALAAFVWWHNLYRFARHHDPTHYAHRYWGRHGGQPTFCPGDYLANVVQFVGGRV